ncbi:formin-like protein 2 isoform X2 [Acanthaster planci]|uniref:Formin-like protein 2 isoform X2 n=1 Tax=Acanthaster planci TaxID=133434 RepID=A0A8B7ZAL5_ACAPL|nr:formin-like protein 2 isoform X2 [Acanthaster planci]
MAGESEAGLYGLKPSKHIIERKFRILLSTMPLEPEQIQRMESMESGDKWRMICEQPSVPSLHSPKFYIDQLRAHMNPNVHSLKKVPKKLIKDLLPTRSILADLKEDLKAYNTEFMKEFISETLNGAEVLCRFIRDTQNLLIDKQRLANSTSAEKQSTIQKKQKYFETLKREQVDESDALFCLKCIASNEKGRHIINTGPDILETISFCIISRSLASRLNAFKILTYACEARDGHDRVLNVFNFLRIKIKEKVRFHALSQMLKVERLRTELVVACLKFINKLLNTTRNLNRRVYLQYELELAEFDAIELEKSYHGDLPQPIKAELDEWHDHFISIQGLQDNLAEIQERNDLLRREVDLQQEKIREYTASKTELQQKLQEVDGKSQEYRERVVELQDTLEHIRKVYRQQTGQDLETRLKSYQLLMKPLDLDQSEPSLSSQDSSEAPSTGSVTPIVSAVELNEQPRSHIGNRVDSTASTAAIKTTGGGGSPSRTAAVSSKIVKDSSLHLPIQPVTDQAPSVPAAPSPPTPGMPTPPPAPPMFGQTDSRRKRRIISSAPMPMLNWVTLYPVTNTIFKTIDDERVLNELDFTDFERNFRLRESKYNTAGMERVRRLQERLAEKITVIETNRARNLVITKRRIGLSTKAIKDAIDKCDTSLVAGEFAELLLKFLPTKEELKSLAKHADDYEGMGEAEQFMFQMARVDRYESKLRLMAFMGIYKELIDSLQPDMTAIVKAAESIMKSKKLKKLFEIILAFGNYMNSSRRGTASGFRLETLDNLTFVKAADRSHNFLNYLAETVRRCYPEVHNWYEDLLLDQVKSSSLESLTMDIHGLRKGLELAKSERDRQQNNPIIDEFYKASSDKVYELSERFKIMEDTYKHLCTLFGVKHKEMEPSEFFKVFTQFGIEYKKAAKENLDRPIRANPARKQTVNATRQVSAEEVTAQAQQKPQKSKLFFSRGSSKSKSSNSNSVDIAKRSSPTKLSSPASSDSGVFLTATPEMERDLDSIPYAPTYQNGHADIHGNNNDEKTAVMNGVVLLGQRPFNVNNNSDSYAGMAEDDGYYNTDPLLDEASPSGTNPVYSATIATLDRAKPESHTYRF